MDPEIKKKAEDQHVDLMNKVELAISKLYAAKEQNDHLEIWYAVGALEVYKKQSSLLFKLLMSGFIATDEDRDVASEIRSALTEQLETISEIASPLLNMGHKNESDD